MTKKEILTQKKEVEKQQRLAEVHFNKLDDLKGDKEFRKESRITAIQIVRNTNLVAEQVVKEAEIVYQWLIKVLK